jgi:hypothetical protein
MLKGAIIVFISRMERINNRGTMEGRSRSSGTGLKLKVKEGRENYDE